jgi:hypothetical protein
MCNYTTEFDASHRPGMTAWERHHMTKLNDATRNKLKTVSTATVATALFKRGFRIPMIQDVHPLSPEQPVLVGEAFTSPLLRQGCPGNDSLCHGACSVGPRQIGLFWLSRHRRTEHAVSR